MRDRSIFVGNANGVVADSFGPDSLPCQSGLDVLGYVDRLYCRLAVCDLAIVEAGLTTTMELTAVWNPTP